MIKKSILLLLLPLLMACNKDDNEAWNYNSSSTIYSDENATAFSEILLVLKPYVMVDGHRKYVVTDRISNVSLTINNKLWGNFNSFAINTSLYGNTSQSGNYTVSDSIVRYPVIAPYQSLKDTLTTAGEYAQLLNNLMTLEPGFYFCRLSSFEVRGLSGETHSFETTIVKAIEIKENSRSAFLGEFEVLIF
jgi:hypothetical protein